MPLPSHSDRALDVDAVARGLAELEHAMAERDRYRQALEAIDQFISRPRRLDSGAMNQLASLVREALSA